jgi:hypothetical protein
VNCEVCGTVLPHGALFCGECGRAVGVRTARTFHPDSGMPLDAAPEAESVAAPETESDAPTASEDAVPAPADVVHVEPSPRDTAIIEPVFRHKLPELTTEIPFIRPPVVRVPPAVEVPPTVDVPPAVDVEQDLPPEVLVDEAMPPPDPASVRPDPFPWGDRGPAIFSDSDELEQTLIVPRRVTGERFVLQFSTGESVTVFGSGLLGRNPTPQPSEYFDQLVSITDPGKSVSKTHLEFGQEAGSFWVSDRFSGNGSAVREPESSARRLVAGKRYRIVRGTRVDIGEQFFVVS